MYLKLININYAYTQFTIPEQSTKRFNELTPKYTCAMRFAWKSYSNIHILCLWIILKEILAGQESRMLLDNVKAREREKRDMSSAIGLFLFHRDRLPRFIIKDFFYHGKFNTMRLYSGFNILQGLIKKVSWQFRLNSKLKSNQMSFYVFFLNCL